MGNDAVTRAIAELRDRQIKIELAIQALQELSGAPEIPAEKVRSYGITRARKTHKTSGRKSSRKPGGAKVVPERKPRASKKPGKRKYFVAQSEIVDLLKRVGTPLTRFIIKQQLEEIRNISVTDDVLKEALAKAKGRGVIEEPEAGTFELVKGNG